MIYHLLRTSDSPRALCGVPASAGAVTITTAKAIAQTAHLCATCLRNFHQIRHDDGPFRPWRQRDRLTG